MSYSRTYTGWDNSDSEDFYDDDGNKKFVGIVVEKTIF